MRIFVSGKFCSGKGFLVRPLLDLGWPEVNFADILKQEVADSYDITVDEINHDKGRWRSILQEWGARRRRNNPQYWIEAWENATKDLPNVVNSDTRYTNEAQYAEKNGLLLRVDCSFIVRRARYKVLYGVYPTDEQLNHPSETELDAYPFEYVNVFNGDGEHNYENHQRLLSLAGLH